MRKFYDIDAIKNNAYFYLSKLEKYILSRHRGYLLFCIQ